MSTQPPPDGLDTLDAADRSTRVPRHHERRRPDGLASAAIATLVVLGIGASAWQLGPTRAEPSLVTREAPAAAPQQAVAEAPPADPAYAGWYAVVDAEGWAADPQQPAVADEKAWYEQDGGAGALSLNWRPADSRDPAWTDPDEVGAQVATTTLDGDRATVHGADGRVLVIGPVREGRFLTLSVTGLTVAEVVELATHVHRQ